MKLIIAYVRAGWPNIEEHTEKLTEVFKTLLLTARPDVESIEERSAYRIVTWLSRFNVCIAAHEITLNSSNNNRNIAST